MMKIFAKLLKHPLLLGLIVCSGYAQDISNYTYSNVSNESLTDMSSGTTQLIARNTNTSASSLTDIGFDFLFMGQMHTQFSVNSNGVLELGSTVDNDEYQLYSIDTYRLLPFTLEDGSDGRPMGTSSSGEVHYKVTGSSPNRVLVVEWLNMEMNSRSNSSDATFQVRLYESAPGSTSPGKIEYVYGGMYCSEAANGRRDASTTQYYTIGVAGGYATSEYGSITSSGFNNGSWFYNTATEGSNVSLVNSSSDGNRIEFTWVAGNTPDAAPSDLNVICYSTSSVSISWTDNATNEIGHAIYRSDDGGTTYSYIDKVDVGDDDYVDTGLSENTEYYYRIYALSEGDFSNLDVTGEVSVTTASSSSSTIYATRNNASWSANSTWSLNAPTSSDDVIIGCGADYTVNINVVSCVAKNLNIENGSTLSFDSGRKLTVENLTNNGYIDLGEGTIVVTGTFTNNGILDPGSGSVVFQGSAKQTLTNTGISTLEVAGDTYNNSTDVAITDDNPIIGGNGIPTAAQLTASGGSTMSVVIPATPEYQSLESVNVTIGHAWLDDIDIYLLTPDNTVILLSSDNGGSTDDYSNITFKDDATEELSDDSDIVDDTSYQPESGNFYEYNGTFAGTWTLYVVDDEQGVTGTLEDFNLTLGTASSDALRYYNVTVENTSGDGLELGSDVYISNTLTLTDGVVNSTSSSQLYFEEGATVSGASDASYVSGPVGKLISAADPAFTFPIGDGGSYQPMGISGATEDDTFTAEYYRNAPSNSNDLESGIVAISTVDWWDLTLETTTSAGVYVTIYSMDFDFSGIPSGSEDYVTVAHYSGGQWNNETASYNEDGMSWTTDSRITSFSPFASASTIDFLPVELVSFTGKNTKEGNLLNWVTASEENNDYFVVERSKDAIEWDEIGRVKGNGTISTMVEYDYVDSNPFVGKTYYRLRQVDFNEEFEYSGVVLVESDSEGVFKFIDLYPNPTSSQVNVDYYSPDENVFPYELSTTSGQILKLGKAYPGVGNNKLSLDVSAYPPGVYVISLDVQDGLVHKKFIVNR